MKKLCLRIRFSEKYPREAPFLQVFYRNFEDLETDDLRFLRNEAQSKALALQNSCEKPVVFELAQFLQEEYEKINEILTFYENMEQENEERRGGFIAKRGFIGVFLENRAKELEISQDEEFYEERFRNDIENQLKMKIIDGGTPETKEKHRKNAHFRNNNDEDFVLEDYDSDFCEISNKNGRLQYFIKKRKYCENRFEE